MVGIKSTLAGAKVFISNAEVTLPLNQAAFEALTWVEIGSVGNLGDYGAEPNMISYNTLNTQVASKAKGVEDAGELAIEVARIYDDAGQIKARAAALTKYNWAVKIQYADSPGVGVTNTVMYAAGPVSGPQMLGGSTDDFLRESYTVAFTDQRPIYVNPV